MEKPISQAYPFLEASSVFVSHNGEFYTSPFFFSRLAAIFIQPKNHPVTDTIPAQQTTLPKKGLIGKKSSSCHLIGARYYDAELGVWIGPDPAGQYLSPYAYGPNSVNGSDPDGKFWKRLGRKIYKGTGTITDKLGKETRQTFRDFGEWAGGDGQGNDDNVFKGMFRSAFGRCGSSSCGDLNNDGLDDSYQYSFGIKLSNHGPIVSGGNGWEVGPGTDMVQKAKAINTPLAPISISETPALKPFEQKSPIPGDEILACPQCLVLVAALGGTEVVVSSAALTAVVMTYVYLTTSPASITPLQWDFYVNYHKGDPTYGLPKPFWHWYHDPSNPVGKQRGDPDLDKEDALDKYKEWDKLGRPNPRDE